MLDEGWATPKARARARAIPSKLIEVVIEVLERDVGREERKELEVQFQAILDEWKGPEVPAAWDPEEL